MNYILDKNVVVEKWKGSMLCCDPLKYIYFKQGYYEKMTAIMDGWENLTPL